MELLNQIPPRSKMVHINWKHCKRAAGTFGWNGVTATL